MDSNLRATILACIFTLLLSVSAAYGVLKLDDAGLKRDVYSLQQLHSRDIIILERQIDAGQLHIVQMMTQQLENSSDSIDKLDEVICRFTNKVEEASMTIARFDERLKAMENHD